SASRPSAKAWKPSSSAGCWPTWAAPTARATCSGGLHGPPTTSAGGSVPRRSACDSGRPRRLSVVARDQAAGAFHQLHELGAQAPAILAARGAGAGGDVAPVPVAQVGAAAQRIGEGRDAGGEAQRFRWRRGDRAAQDGRLDQPALRLV